IRVEEVSFGGDWQRKGVNDVETVRILKFRLVEFGVHRSVEVGRFAWTDLPSWTTKIRPSQQVLKSPHMKMVA
ncbi:MAG: hypothetical protein ACRC5C_00350, partial [Bacilli bacterium]